MAKTAKKAPARKKAPIKKAATKPAMKKTVKPKMAKPVMAAKTPNQPDNFMTRMLQRKEADRIAREEQQKNSNFNMHATNNQLPTGSQGFARFHGPRRKAA